MKETYYKLNREKLERYSICMRMILDMLTDEGILEEYFSSKEEVQEEELFHVEQNDKCYIHKGNVFKYEPADTKEDLPYSVEIENRKIEEESQGMSIKSRHLVQDTINLPNSGDHISGETAKAYYNNNSMFDNSLQKTEITAIHEAINGKPFLDGMKPSEWIEEHRPDTIWKTQINDSKIEGIIEAFDLLVEELKKKGSL